MLQDIHQAEASQFTTTCSIVRSGEVAIEGEHSYKLYIWT